MKNELQAHAAQLSNEELVAHVKHLAQTRRQATASLIAHLAELSERKLHLDAGCASLFSYCMRVLHLSESTSYKCMRVARTAREYPRALEGLVSGALNLATLKLLAPHLTRENHAALLDASWFKSKRRVEKLVAELKPLPDVRTSIRKLPNKSTHTVPNGNGAGTPNAVGAPELPIDGAVVAISAPESAMTLGAEAIAEPAVSTSLGAASSDPATPSAAPSAPQGITPLGAGRYGIQFTASAATLDKLRWAQAHLRHAIPEDDLDAIFDRALTLLVAKLEKTRLASTERPRPGQPTRPGSRHIPAAVRRAVWKRDEARCTYTSPDGRRCSETEFLEIDHVQPYAVGGEATLENLRLLCRAHNRHAADAYFGAEPVQRKIDAVRQRRRKDGSSEVAETAADYGTQSAAVPRLRFALQRSGVQRALQ